MRTVLVVEDEKSLRNILLLELKEFSNEFNRFLSASSGLEALKIIEKEKIDFIITDMKMPMMTGSELLIELKKRNINIPAIITSGFCTQEEISKIMNVKVFNKPYDFDELHRYIDELFSS